MSDLLRLKTETERGSLRGGAVGPCSIRGCEVDHALLSTVRHGCYPVFFLSSGEPEPPLTTSNAVMEWP